MGLSSLVLGGYKIKDSCSAKIDDDGEAYYEVWDEENACGYKDYKVGTTYNLIKRPVKVMHGVDALLGISLVVLGALALVGILPVPSSMVETFGYSAIAVGSFNLIMTSILAYKGYRAGNEDSWETFSSDDNIDDPD